MGVYRLFNHSDWGIDAENSFTTFLTGICMEIVTTFRIPLSVHTALTEHYALYFCEAIR